MTTSTPPHNQPIPLQAGDHACCPHPAAGMQQWNSHPRVYLQPDAHGIARCPYCGTTYQMPAARSGH